MRKRFATAALLILAAGAPAAHAEVLVHVDKASQRMTVSVDGAERYSWPVSTGMAGYITPAGSFTPFRMARTHFSKEWDDAPMPHSIFFTEAGHAVHGSRVTGRLGSPASHGCIRLSPAHAATLFNLVKAEGMASTRIEVAGDDPGGVGGGTGRGFGGLTSFDPLASGIMVDGPAPRRTPPRP
jgi:hypothetical protein